jgi:hypothetical protein
MTLRALSRTHDPMTTKKPKQVRLYLNEEASDLLEAAGAEIRDLSEAQIASFLVMAGLRAIKLHGYKLTFPLHLDLVQASGNPSPTHPKK